MPEITTALCDPCHVSGFDREGAPHLVGCDDRIAQVILCPQCETQFLRPINHLVTVGLPVADLGEVADAERREDAAGPVRAPGPPSSGEIEDGKMECPSCHDRISKKRIYKHCRNRHGLTLSEARAGASPRVVRAPAPSVRREIPCGEEGCTEKFETPQGRGAHRFRRHGLAGSSAATVQRRASATPEQIGLVVVPEPQESPVP